MHAAGYIVHTMKCVACADAITAAGAGYTWLLHHKSRVRARDNICIRINNYATAGPICSEGM